jgi:hypothetical protein
MKETLIRESWERIEPHLDEKRRRLWCANEALRMGRGGVQRVSAATGMSAATIIEGKKELSGEKALAGKRVRRKGGGRKRAVEKDPSLRQEVIDLVQAATRGDPESALLWSSKSTAHLAKALNREGHRASERLVARLLREEGYRLQANKKTREGGSQEDRDAQFSYINKKTKAFQKQGQPVISVDTKKKENIGNFRNAGQEYHKKGQAPQVNVYDFLDKEKGKVCPYGVYDLDKNKGWVSVGVSADTAEFAVHAIRSWWYEMGKETYPGAQKLYINADGGGSNGWRNRLWKVELQKLANEVGLAIHVSHFPPGTSKWNKIEHRMFCFISQNWRGRPLIDRATVVNLIANTRTKTGLTIRAKLDEKHYAKGIKVSDEDLAQLTLHKDRFRGEWNYKIKPRV